LNGSAITTVLEGALPYAKKISTLPVDHFLRDAIPLPAEANASLILSVLLSPGPTIAESKANVQETARVSLPVVKVIGTLTLPPVVPDLDPTVKPVESTPVKVVVLDPPPPPPPPHPLITKSITGRTEIATILINFPKNPLFTI
jgi:hypothetical protein